MSALAGDGPIDFSALYRAHARDVHRFVVLLCGDLSAADDIVSETFVRAWHARSRAARGDERVWRSGRSYRSAGQ